MKKAVFKTRHTVSYYELYKAQTNQDQTIYYFGIHTYFVKVVFFLSKRKWYTRTARRVVTFGEEAWEQDRKGTHTNKLQHCVVVSVTDIRCILCGLSGSILEVDKGATRSPLATPHRGGTRVPGPGPDTPLCRRRARVEGALSPPWLTVCFTFFPSFLLQHVIYSVKFFLSYAIPDVSKSTKSKIKREKYLTQKLLHENHLKDMTKNLAEHMIGVVDNHLRPKLE